MFLLASSHLGPWYPAWQLQVLLPTQVPFRQGDSQIANAKTAAVLIDSPQTLLTVVNATIKVLLTWCTYLNDLLQSLSSNLC